MKIFTQNISILIFLLCAIHNLNAQQSNNNSTNQWLEHETLDYTYEKSNTTFEPAWGATEIQPEEIIESTNPFNSILTRKKITRKIENDQIVSYTQTWTSKKPYYLTWQNAALATGAVTGLGAAAYYALGGSSKPTQPAAQKIVQQPMQPAEQKAELPVPAAVNNDNQMIPVTPVVVPTEPAASSSQAPDNDSQNNRSQLQPDVDVLIDTEIKPEPSSPSWGYWTAGLGAAVSAAGILSFGGDSTPTRNSKPLPAGSSQSARDTGTGTGAAGRVVAGADAAGILSSEGQRNQETQIYEGIDFSLRKDSIPTRKPLPYKSSLISPSQSGTGTGTSAAQSSSPYISDQELLKQYRKTERDELVKSNLTADKRTRELFKKALNDKQVITAIKNDIASIVNIINKCNENNLSITSELIASLKLLKSKLYIEIENPSTQGNSLSTLQNETEQQLISIKKKYDTALSSRPGTGTGAGAAGRVVAGAGDGTYKESTALIPHPNFQKTFDDAEIIESLRWLEINPDEYFRSSEQAKNELIRKAVHKLSSQYHPDKPGGSIEKFTSLKLAQELLLNNNNQPTELLLLENGKLNDQPFIGPERPANNNGPISGTKKPRVKKFDIGNQNQKTQPIPKSITDKKLIMQAELKDVLKRKQQAENQSSEINSDANKAIAESKKIKDEANQAANKLAATREKISKAKARLQKEKNGKEKQDLLARLELMTKETQTLREEAEKNLEDVKQLTQKKGLLPKGAFDNSDKELSREDAKLKEETAMLAAELKEWTAMLDAELNEETPFLDLLDKAAGIIDNFKSNPNYYQDKIIAIAQKGTSDLEEVTEELRLKKHKEKQDLPLLELMTKETQTLREEVEKNLEDVKQLAQQKGLLPKGADKREAQRNLDDLEGPLNREDAELKEETDMLANDLKESPPRNRNKKITKKTKAFATTRKTEFEALKPSNQLKRLKKPKENHE